MLLPLRSPLIPRLLLVLFLSLICLYAKAYTGSQNDHPVTLNGNTTLRAVFKAIKQQTGFAVMYSTAATALNQDEKMTVNFKDTPLDDVLAYLLRGKDLEWKYSDDVLVIHKKETLPAEKKMVTDSTVTPAMITGKITDAAGAALPGVTVQVKGTSQGTTTNENGSFSLPKVSIGQTLLLSMIGYETQAIPVKGKSILAQLRLAISSLDETQVIAYGTTTQRLSTGNIATIQAKDIEKQPVNNPLLALQGRVPGLFITQANGLPGSGITVRIQGQNSINNGNSPLYIVDGVPYPYELPGTGISAILGNSGENANGAPTGSGNTLSLINPADIESITVLKDADATSIYGSRAANGAVLITTKKGVAGKMVVDVNLQQGWGKVTRKLKMLNTPQYVEMRREAFKNDGITPTLDNAPDLLLWDTTLYTDWQKTLIGNTAHFTNLQAGLSGGTAVVQYLVRGTFQRETTPFPGNFADEREGLHFNLNTASANQKFHFQLSGNYLVDNNQLPNADFTSAAIGLEPNAPPVYTHDGTLNWMLDLTGKSTFNNPLAELLNTYQNKTSNLISSASFSYQLAEGLSFRSNFGYNNIQSTIILLNPLMAIQPEQRSFSQRSATYGNRRNSSWIMEPQLTYEKKIGQGSLNLLLGGTVQQSFNNSETIFGSGYNSDLVLENMAAATSLMAYGTLASTYKYTALYSRINYNWRDKYIINLSGRRDGSSRFGARNRFSNFGAVGAAWIFTEEPLLKETSGFLSYGKLRASYGTTGSDQINDYTFLNLYNQVFVGVPYQGVNGLLPNGLVNPYLEWETTRKLQLGTDLGFLNDRILLNATYARNRSSNQLLNLPLPSVTGRPSILQNLPATVQNTSWEFTLHTINIETRQIHWSSNVNLTLPRNKLVAYPGLAASTQADFLVIGQPLSVVKTYHLLGVDPVTGDYTVADAMGKPTTTPDYIKDRTVLSSPQPRFYGGVQNSFTYKGFQLDFLFQFVKQVGTNALFYNGISASPGVSSFFQPGNQPISVLDRWQKPGDNAAIQRYSTATSPAFYNAISSNAAYTDASFIRLKNIAVSWQLPESWTQQKHFSCRIYLQAENLLTITHYKGLDPENQTVVALPPLKMLTAGIQLKL